MPNLDINKVPKHFCDNALAARAKESFSLGLLSGEHASFFAFSPQHFKRLVKNLAYQLTEYEKEYGAIDAEWVPGVQSPIQTKDIQKGDTR